jgi:hypothetical protein
MVTSISSEPARAAPKWQIRLLGAGIGALLPFAFAIVTLPTVILAIIAAFGVFAGIVVGAAYGPSLVATSRRTPHVLRAGGVAFLIGSASYVATAAIAEGHGASPLDLLAFAFQVGVPLVLGVGIISAPMALLSAWVATITLVRLAPRARFLWAPALVLAAAAFAVTANALAAQFVATGGDGGDMAARLGDQVPFEFLIIDQGHSDHQDRGYTLEIRSYWHGEVDSATSANAYGLCTRDSMTLASDWVVWIGSERDPTWDDRPPVASLASSEDFPYRGAANLTIIIAPDGTATWLRGIADWDCKVIVH